MSVINEMLRDLERRKGDGGAAAPSSLMAGVRPRSTPTVAERAPSPWLAIAPSAVLVVGMLLGFALIERRIDRAVAPGTEMTEAPPPAPTPVVSLEPSALVLQEAARALLAEMPATPPEPAPPAPAPVPAMGIASPSTLPGNAAAPRAYEAPAEPSRLLDTRLERGDTHTRLTFQLSTPTTHVVERDEENHVQLVLRGTRLTGATPQLSLGGTLLRSIHVSSEGEDVRVVLEPARAVRAQSTMLDDGNGARLVLSFEPADAPKVAQNRGFRIVAEEPPARSAGPAPAPAPAPVPEAEFAPEAAETPEAAEAPAAAAPVGTFRKTAAAPSSGQIAEQSYRRGLEMIAAGVDEIGMQALREALTYQPKYLAARTALVQALVRTKRYDEARQEIAAGRAAHPDHPAFAKLEARILIAEGRADAALAVLVRDAPPVQQDPEYHAMVAALHQRAGDHERAAQAFHQLLSLRADRAAWWMGLAISLEGKGEAADALTAYRNAASLGGLGNDSLSFTQERIATLSGGRGLMRKRIRIGELLVSGGIITQAQLEDALTRHKQLGKRLGRTLIDLGYVGEQEFLTFLANQLHIRYVDLKEFKVERETVLRLPETHARRLRSIVLEDTGKEFLVGMADPTDLFAFDELQGLLKRSVEVAVVREADLVRTIDQMYGRSEEIEQLAGELHNELAESDFDVEQLEVADDPTDAPVARLLQSVFEEAVRLGASDVHIEPDENVLRIRQRVDGVLQEHVVNEKRIATALVLRLKLMSSLDISEKRLPQDGRFNIRVRGSSIDVRLSTMPVQYGESVVMRLLDQSHEMQALDALGVPDPILKRIRMLIHRPHGLILVTGPTGSGKTTTLYACLRALNEPVRKIITVEDPVEYRLPRIQQVQVHPRIGLTFASVLRTTLRQDPDVLMVGEMRDQETAEIGLRAAITGHLVFSTLHTNDAIASGMRLVDMGAQGYLVASALRAVIAQRLVRRVCDRCAEPYTPTAQEMVWVRAMAGAEAENMQLKKGRGCTRCAETGYRGRVGVYEMLEIDNDCADALRRNDSAAFAAAARATDGFRALTMCAFDYAKQGLTSLEEVFRVAETLEDTEDATQVEATASLLHTGVS